MEEGWDISFAAPLQSHAAILLPLSPHRKASIDCHHGRKDRLAHTVCPRIHPVHSRDRIPIEAVGHGCSHRLCSRSGEAVGNNLDRTKDLLAARTQAVLDVRRADRKKRVVVEARCSLAASHCSRCQEVVG